MPSSRLRRRAKRIRASVLNDLASDLVHLIFRKEVLPTKKEEGDLDSYLEPVSHPLS